MPEYEGDPKARDVANYADGMTGRCLCGGIKVTIKKGLFAGRNGHLCHCENCRKFSGCSATNNLMIEKKDVIIDDPKALAKTYNDAKTGSGVAIGRSFCSNCGSPVYELSSDTDQQYVLPLGIFPRIPEPEFELFAAHRHEWNPRINGARQYKYMTSSGELE